MQIQHLVQNTPAWHAYRGQHDNASDAAAMMGVSPRQSRDALIAQLATGVQREFSDYVQRRILDKGHDFERLARPLAQAIIGEDLFPVTACEDDGRLSASLDGLTMMEDTAWEHKRLNQRLRDVLTQPGCTGKDLPMDYQIQMEQQCAVSGCERVLFMASEWDDDGHLIEDLHCWYTPNAELRSAIRAGWAQLHKDVAAYVAPEAKAAPVVAAPMETLPAVSVRVDGQLAIISNLPAFGEALRAFIARIPDSPKTDQEFADTEAACKSLKQAEDALAASESNALAQLEDVDTMRRLVADCRNLARTTRLQKEKLVTAQKELLRGEAVAGGVTALRQHIAVLHASVGKPWVQVPQANFGTVIKGMRSLDSIRGAINDELARCKIEADAQARRIVANIRVLEQVGHGFLFPDAQQLATAHGADTFTGLVHGRIAQHQAAEQKRQDAERERIRAEEVAKLQRETAARAHAEEAAERRRQDQHAAAQAAQRAAELAEATERAAAVIAQAAAPAPALLAISMYRCCEKAVAEGVEICQECRQSLEDWREVRAQEHVDRNGPDSLGAFFPGHPAAVVQHGYVPDTENHPEDLLPAAHDTGERINLGAINQHLAPISINAAGLAALGFEPVAVVKASKLYRADDLPRIRAALVRHLQGLALQAA